jgi:hypothetical protein
MRARAYLIRCAAAGEEANFEREFPEPSERCIEAGWIRDLLLGKVLSGEMHGRIRSAYQDYSAPAGDGPALLSPGNLRVRGVLVSGNLDLSCCGSAHEPLASLAFTACRFETTDGALPSIDLSEAHIGGIRLRDSRLVHLRGVGMCVDGSVDLSGIRPLDDHQSTQCWCNLSRSVINGHLLADRVRLYAPRHAPRSGEQYLDFFEVHWALNLHMARVSGSVIMIAPTIDGGMLMTAAHVQGDVRLSRAMISSLANSPSIAVERTHIGGSFALDDTADAQRMIEGTIWMMLTNIAGSLDFQGVTIQGSKSIDSSLYAVGTTVCGWVTLKQVKAAGLICLRNMHVDGRMQLDNLQVTGSTHLRSWFALPDWLPRSKEDKSHPPFALDMNGARIAASLQFINNALAGGVDLSDAHCATLDDDELRGYGAAPQVGIDGFSYERLASGPESANDRLDNWLPGKLESYRPQPYVQLAKVLASHGDDIHAREVLVRKAGLDARLNWDRILGSKAGSTPWARGLDSLRLIFRRLIYYLILRPYCLFFSYGLSPMRAASTLVASILLGAAMFWWMDHRSAMVVAQTPVATYVAQGKADIVGARVIPKFVASMTPKEAGAIGTISCGLNTGQFILYAADVFIPLVDLREENKCEIDGVVNADPMPSDEEIALYQLMKAGYAILGWVVTTLSLLTFSGVMRHRLSQD